MILLDQTQHLKDATFQYHLGDLPNQIMHKQSSLLTRWDASGINYTLVLSLTALQSLRQLKTHIPGIVPV